MKHFLFYSSIAIFSIFVGSQITEGVLLVPYWQSLSASDFYSFYQQFGPLINQFYTVLTIAAVLIPVVVSVYFKWINSNALYLALISSFFAILVIACFYIYFKDTNALFFQAGLSDVELEKELVKWGRCIGEGLPWRLSP